MAKTAPLKNKNAPSKHSRAARRASSPSISTDKSLKEVKPPTDLKQPILTANTGSGVKKSKGRKSVLSTKARKRHEKSMDIAEAVMDRTTKKIDKSKGRARNVQDRAKAWEDLNKQVLAEKSVAKKSKADENWEDIEYILVAEGEVKGKTEEGDDEIEMEDEIAAASPTPAAQAAQAAQVALPVEDEDLIL